MALYVLTLNDKSGCNIRIVNNRKDNLMTKREIKVTISFTVVVALLTVAACAAPKQPQAETTKGEIVIGILDDFSGPLASICDVQTDARLDAIRYINEEKGGIDDHPLRGLVIDHKMDASLIISGWDRIKASNAPIDVSTSAAAAVVIQSACEQDHIPVISGGGLPDLVFPKQPSYFFSTVPWFWGIYESLGDMIQKDWTKRGETRPAKVGFDCIAFGNYAKIYAKCSKMISEKQGFEYTITYTGMAPADVTTQVLQAKNFDCDYVYLMTPSTGVIPWLKELERQSFEPVTFGSTGLAAAEVWQATGDLASGTTGYQYGPQWDEINYPLVKLANELNAKWHPDVTWRAGHYMRGFSEVMVLAEALKRALETSGFDQLNGDTMKAAMETIKDYDPGIGTAYTWTPTDHQGVTGIRWYQWTDEGKLVSDSDWYQFAPLPDEMKTTAWWLTE